MLLAPGDEPERGGGIEEPERDRLPPGSPRRAIAVRVPIVAMRYANSTPPAIAVRASISAPGEKPPSTPTLMKRYDAPQREARISRRGQYRLVTPDPCRTRADDAGGERGTREDEREAGKCSQSDGLVQEHGAIREGERGHEVGDEDRP